MVMRTYGLSGSGMDIDSLVKDLMKARRSSYNSIYKQRTQLEWKKTDYNSIYTSINSFRSNTVFNFKLDNTLMPKLAASSNETVATVKANAEAADMNHSLVVSQIADGVKQTSSGAITTGASKDTLAGQFGLGPDDFNITLTNGTESKVITVDPSASIYEFVSQINTAGVNVKANYDATLDRFFLYTANSGASAEIDFTGTSAAGFSFLTQNLKLPTMGHAGTDGLTSQAALGVTDPAATLASQFSGMAGSFTLKVANGASTADIVIDTAVDTLNSVISRLNAAGVNADASYDAGTDKFSLAAVSGTLDFSGSDPAAFEFLSNRLKLAEAGKDAKFTLDGVSLSQASNTFTVSGITYTLKAAGSATVTASTDTEKAVASVKSFIDEYNKLLDKVNDEVSEARYKNILPLTDEEKAAMKESDVKTWEEKAKSGLLRNDPILRDLAYKMRSSFSSPISGITGKYNSAASIGITTGSYTEEGKLYLDENKLRAALEADPEVLEKIFGTDGDSSSVDGIAVRLYDNLKATSDRLAKEGGVTASSLYDTSSNLGKRINDYSKRMDAMLDRLKQEEDRYYSQFDAMEAALSRLNQQSSWLTSQFSQSS